MAAEDMVTEVLQRILEHGIFIEPFSNGIRGFFRVKTRSPSLCKAENVRVG